MTTTDPEAFTLFDLRVEVVEPRSPMVCSHHVGDYFDVVGEDIVMPRPFSLYALSALLPLLPAKQRMTDAADWMTTDTTVACPDPHCGGLFRISRVATRQFSHSDVSAVEMTAVGETL